MRHILENTIATSALIAAEAWFLKGYYGGAPEFEPFITFLGALGVVLLKDPIQARFSRKTPTNEAPQQDKALQHDRTLFAEFSQVLPFDPSIRFLRDQDFSDRFRRESLRSLNDFAWLWDSVEKEFVDQELEQARCALNQSAIRFRMEVANRAVPIGTGEYLSVWSDAQRRDGDSMPEDSIEDGRALNELAGAFAFEYEAFVRKCKAKLSV